MVIAYPFASQRVPTAHVRRQIVASATTASRHETRASASQFAKEVARTATV